jgi:hypothetical protein
MRQWRVRSALLRCLEERYLIPEHSGWAKDSCVTSRRFHEAVLRVIASPPAEARLFVITGKAVTSRPRSTPILIGCWFVLPFKLVELANTTSSLKGITKRGREGPSLFLNGDACFGSKPARRRYSFYFAKDGILHEVPEEPSPLGQSPLYPPTGTLDATRFLKR